MNEMFLVNHSLYLVSS